jgi:putative Mg2+ transporter-C (MgtC) family protein
MWETSAQWGLVVPLVIAAVLGACLGLERTLAGKHAGMRTYALVSLGSAVFALIGTLASYQLSAFGGINPLQIAGSVVIGIGFIGAGLAAGGSTGGRGELTTASGIWVAAGIGMACGFGLYALAVLTALIAMVILSLLLHVENAVREYHRTPDGQ